MHTDKHRFRAALFAHHLSEPMASLKCFVSVSICVHLWLNCVFQGKTAAAERSGRSQSQPPSHRLAPWDKTSSIRLGSGGAYPTGRDTPSAQRQKPSTIRLTVGPFTSPESHSLAASSAESVVGPSHLWQADGMKAKLNLIYWKSDKFWLGRLAEHPEIMTQGRTLKELEENIRDAYQLMVLEDVPHDYAVKEVAV